jgi:hypothetical protein
MAKTGKKWQFPTSYPQAFADRMWFPRRFGECSRVRFNRHRRARYRLHNRGKQIS